MAKNCKATIKCLECASEKHVSALHVGPPPELWNTGESKEKTLEGAKQSTPEKEASSYGEEGIKVSTKCTKVCHQSPGGKSCSKICLANNYTAAQPERKVRVYVVINDQSNCSLAKPMLFNKLSSQGETIAYMLHTCAGQSKVEGRVAKGVIVESLDSTKSHMLSKLIECSAILDGKNETTMPQVALAHPHLRPITNKISELEAMSIFCCTRCMSLRMAEKAFLGPILTSVGSLQVKLAWMVLINQMKQVSTFKTQLLHNHLH